MLHSLPGSTGRASAVALALLALDNWLILSGSTHTDWLCSEVVCWLSLAVGYVVAAQSSLVTFRPQTRAALRLGFPTVIALCAAVSAICVSSNSRVLRSSPFVVVLVTLAQIFTTKDVSESEKEEFSPGESRRKVAARLSLSLIATLFLYQRPTTLTLALQILYVMAQSILYITLERKFRASNGSKHSDALSELVGITILQTAVLVLASALGFSGVGLFQISQSHLTLLQGISKALLWVLLFTAVRDDVSYFSGPSSQVFALSLVQIGDRSASPTRQLAYFCAAIAAQSTTSLQLPKSAKVRRWFMALIVLPILLLLSRDTAQAGVHPVRMLFEKNLADFHRSLEDQSHTYEIAVTRYQKRYGRKPPPGFPAWYSFAVRKNSAYMDDYDIIHEVLEPYWKVAPSRLRQLVSGSLSMGHLSNLNVTNGTFYYKEDNGWAKRLHHWVEDVAHELPDLTLLLNGLDEPTVIHSSHVDDGIKPATFEDITARPAWDLVTNSCPRATGDEDDCKDCIFGIPFVRDVKDAKNICRHPEYKKKHAFFLAPATLRYTIQPIPVWSQTAPSTFGDIPFPIPYYWDVMDDRMDELDMTWENKTNTMYWTGTTTGGRATDPRWHNYHRHRFVALTQQLLKKPTRFLTETRHGFWQSYESMDILRELYDTKFTNVAQCEGAECEAQRAYFHTGPGDPASTRYAARFVMDLDGNSFSGRYYNLLLSRSCVFKQTIFREWHDDRLIPWVHYVPISIGMEELPEVMRYLALTQEGSDIAKRIGEEGRRWVLRALREEDASVFLHRLLLEYASVFDDERDLRQL